MSSARAVQRVSREARPLGWALSLRSGAFGFRSPLAVEVGFLVENDDDSSSPVATLGEATPPEQCSAVKLHKAFLRGWHRGRQRVAALWDNYGACDRVDEFVDQLILGVQELLPDKEPDKVRKRCRYVGMIEGVFAELDAIQQGCVTECFTCGDVVGPIEAKAYCDLVIDAQGELEPVPWIRMPVGTCGFSFEIGCDAQFLATSRIYSNESGTCLPYTIAPYYDIWDASRLKSCDYDQQE